MDADDRGEVKATPNADTSGSRPLGWLASPFLWGAAATAGFYQAIPHLPAYGGLLERYFCGHPLEYVLAGMFFVGMAILLRKAVGVRAEKSALDAGHRLVATLLVPESEPPADSAAQIESRLAEEPGAIQRSVLMTRIRDACDHVRSRCSTKNLSEHLKYLAELAAERLYESYALVRTITWAVPIVGFLGTVIGITLAISNLTPEQLDTSLNAVTSGLGVAFDTTALALALSVVLVFTSFLVERAEQRVLTRVEDFGIRRIAGFFPHAAENQTPLVEAETRAAKQLIEKTETLIAEQTELWQSALASTRESWMAALTGQKQEFDEALQSGMRATLADHAEQLNMVRDGFLDAFREVSAELRAGLTESRDAQRDLQDDFRSRMDELWNKVQSDVGRLQDEQQAGLDRLTQAVAERVGAWQTELREATQAGAAQLGEIRKQREVLLEVAGQEEQIVRLQARLADNLDTLRASETFEETMHSLSAAVHLLSARTKPKAA